MDEQLFKTTTKYTFKEYEKFNNVLRSKSDRLQLRISLLVFTILLIYLIVTAFIENDINFGILLIIILILFPILLLKIMKTINKKVYDSHPSWNNTEYKIMFYENYLEQTNENFNPYKLEYKDINCILETKTNFYFMVTSNQGVIIVKNNCSPKLISFLQELKNK